MSALHFIFVVLTLILKVSCQDMSLTFVVDNTNSMTDDIEDFKKVVFSIMDIVLKQKSSQISNIVLVSFNDPDNSTVRKNARNRADFTTALETLPIGGGTDCAELALSGIKLALDSSLPGSYIYVLTDASAKDYWINQEIEQLCRTKQSQIVFIIPLSGDCGHPDRQGFQVYYNISAASSGMTIRVPKRYVANVVNKFVEEDIKGNKFTLAAKLTPSEKKTTVTFYIDDLTTYAIVSVSGTDVRLSHFEGPSLETENIIWEKHAKVVKLLDTEPGEYTVSVKSSSVTSVVVTGRSDFYFHYGFSKRKANSLNDTTPQPISDEKTHLSLLVADPEFSVLIQAAQILDMKANVIQELPLEELSPNFYTTASFLAPSDTFKVALIGEVIETNRPIRRIAKIPVTKQTPPPESPKVTGVDNQEVRLGAEVSIKCNVVKGVPNPELSWQFKPINSSEFTDINDTGDVWSSSNVTSEHSGSYKCIARNSQGTDQHIIRLTVKGPPRNISDSTELRIPCDTFSFPKPYVKWEVNGSPITPGDKYDIKDDELIIKNPTESDNTSNYTCTVSKMFKVYVGERFSNYGILRDVNILQGHALKLTCSLPRVGSSTVQWSTDEDDIGFDQPNVTVENAQASDDGNYTCHVNDVNGSAKETFLVDVGFPPSFKIQQTNSTIVWDEYSKYMLRCDVIAKPVANIEWTIDGERLVGESHFQLFIFKKGNYTCNVSNVHGAVQRNFDVQLIEYPI